MANSGINHFGIGLGYIYVTNFGVSDFITVQPNNQAGVLAIRNMALKNAPIAANRSAIAIMQVLTAAGTGNLTDITLSGVSQILAPVPCASSNTGIVAQTWADAINACTPVSGPKLTAGVQGDLIYVFGPESAGDTLNGITLIISTDVGSLTASVTAFEGGSTNTGIVDDLLGYRYWLDADYGPSGVAGSTPAAPNPALPLLYAIEITNDITRRGLETGIYNEDATLSSDTMLVVRKSSITEYHLNNEGAVASDYLVRINPLGFIEGDIITLSNDNVAQATEVLSPPDAESVSATPNPNVFLTNFSRFSASRNNVLMLQFHYDDIFGGIFREIGRSNPASFITINRTNTLYIDSTYGNASGAREEFYPNAFQTANAAIAAAQAGDTLVFSKDTYAVSSQLLQLANITVDLRSGATLTGSTYLTSIGAGSKIKGGHIVHTGSFAQIPGDYSSIDCDTLEIGVMEFANPNHFTLNVRELLTCHGYINLTTSSNTYLKWQRAIFDNGLVMSGIYCLGFLNSALGSVPNVQGDIYVTANFDSIISCVNTTVLTYSPRYKGNIYIAPGAYMNYGIRSYSSRFSTSISPYRFIVEGEFHSPVAPQISIINALGGGAIEFKGKMFLSNQGAKPAVISDTEAATRNAQSLVYLTDCDIYSDTTGPLMQINDIGFTGPRSKIIGKNLKTICPSASSLIVGDVAGCLYQCQGWWSNKAVGANVANELSTTNIQVDALMV